MVLDRNLFEGRQPANGLNMKATGGEHSTGEKQNDTSHRVSPHSISPVIHNQTQDLVVPVLNTTSEESFRSPLDTDLRHNASTNIDADDTPMDESLMEVDTSSAANHAGKPTRMTQLGADDYQPTPSAATTQSIAETASGTNSQRIARSQSKSRYELEANITQSIEQISMSLRDRRAEMASEAPKESVHLQREVLQREEVQVEEEREEKMVLIHRLSCMRSENIKLSDQIASLKLKPGACREHVAQLEDLEIQTTALKENLASVGLKLAASEKELEQAQDALKASEVDRRDAKDLIKTLSQQLAISTQDNTGLTNTIRRSDRSIVDLRYDTAELAFELATLRGVERGNIDSLVQRLPAGKVSDDTVRRLLENPAFEYYFPLTHHRQIIDLTQHDQSRSLHSPESRHASESQAPGPSSYSRKRSLDDSLLSGNGFAMMEARPCKRQEVWLVAAKEESETPGMHDA